VKADIHLRIASRKYRAWSNVVLNALGPPNRGLGPRGPPDPLRSILIHTFSNFNKNVDQGGSGWTRGTRGTITPLGGPGLVFTFR